jgi:hypothetical protein
VLVLLLLLLCLGRLLLAWLSIQCSMCVPAYVPLVRPAVPDLEIALSAFKSDADLCCCLANAYLQYKHGAERRAQVCASLLYWRPASETLCHAE